MLNLRTGKEMTRRETIKGGLGLAAILAAGKAPAMLLGARGVAFGEKKNPYQTEDLALIAMWDGIWNCGIGKHTSDKDGMRDCITDEIIGTYSKNSFSVSDDCILWNTLNVSTGIILKCSINTAYSTSQMGYFASQYNMTNVGSNLTLTDWKSKTYEMYAYPKTTSPTFRVQVKGLDRDSGVKFYTGVNYNISFVNSNNDIKLYNHSSKFYSYNYYSTGETIKNINFVSAGFTGKMRFARVYNRPLTDKEISNFNAIDKERFSI